MAFGHRQHLRRPVHTKDRHTPTLAQVASKESCAAADVSSGAKLYAVSSYKCFESSASANEVGNAKRPIVRRRKLAVRPGETVSGGNCIAHNRGYRLMGELQRNADGLSTKKLRHVHTPPHRTLPTLNVDQPPPLTQRTTINEPCTIRPSIIKTSNQVYRIIIQELVVKHVLVPLL